MTEPITDQERQSLTVWGETFSAQIRPGGMALSMRADAPRSTESGRPYLMEWPDVDKLWRLLVEAQLRGRAMTADFPFPADTADAIADVLRTHGWTATTAWHCGCAPAGLCPTHQHMRDEEQS